MSFSIRGLRSALRKPRFALLGGLGVAALSVLAAAAAQKADIADLRPQAVEISARPFDFERSNPARRDFGRLEWRGGLILSSANPVFGGYSGLAIADDGERMLAVSDAGSWLSARIIRKNGRLAGLGEARLGPITQADGRPLQRQWDRDAESLAALKPGRFEGRYLIGFEGNHRLEDYEFKDGALRGPLRRGGIPRQLRAMSRNRGLEGVAFLRGGLHAGSLVAFAERKLSRNGDHSGALVARGKSHALFLMRERAFDITDLAALKDGSLLVLERSFVKAALKLDIRLRLIPAREIGPGARLKGEVLLEAGGQYVIDNFEALAVHETEAGETIVTLMSDDNFSFFQSTLLAQFALQAD
jgi:hypothetical protein